MSTRGVKKTPPRVDSGAADASRAREEAVRSAMLLSPFGICFWGLSLAALDGDLARPGRLVLRQRDVQHAVVEAGLDLVGVHRERQGQHAGEAAERPLLAVADALLRHHRLALALEGQLVAARDEDLQVIQVQSGKLGLDVDGL